MFSWLTGEKEKGSTRLFGLATPELEKKAKKLDELRAEQERTTQRMNKQSEIFLKVHALRERISLITRRNKTRSILVIPFMQEDNPLVEILLAANSNAQATYATSLDHARRLLETQHFDMVYVVIDMAQEGHGPCFFSTDHELDAKAREEYSGFKKYVEEVKPMTNGAEIVVVCGTARSRCPIAEKLFESGPMTRKFEREVDYEANIKP